MRGRFVVFEGIDGSGKSSTLGQVAVNLRREFPLLATTREETVTETGDWVRRSIEERWDPLATTFLFLADRARHVEDLRRWLDTGRPVLCDRYLHSTLAYQSVTLRGRLTPDAAGRGAAGRDDAVTRAFLRRLHEPWAIPPDHVLLFKADPKRCVARVHARAEAEGRTSATPFEKVQFLAQVQDEYLALAREEPDVFHVLDAERPLDKVVADATDIVRRWLAAPTRRSASSAKSA